MKRNLSPLSSRNAMFQQTARLGQKKGRKKKKEKEKTTGEKSDDPL